MKGGRGYWPVNYAGTQSFINSFFYFIEFFYYILIGRYKLSSVLTCQPITWSLEEVIIGYVHEFIIHSLIPSRMVLGYAIFILSFSKSLYLKLKISITTEPIEFFILGLLQIDPRMVLGYFIVKSKPCDGFRLFFANFLPLWIQSLYVLVP